MQNDGKLSSHGNLGFAQAASLRKPNAPAFEGNVPAVVELGREALPTLSR
jgi:hypothetical protein